MKNLSLTTLLSLILTILNNSLAFSQPSLSADDIKEMVISHKNKAENYTLLRDATKRSQWYFIPKEPRLTEVMINGELNPEFTLMRYQFVDPTSTSGSFDGGIVQFAVVITPEPGAITLLKDKLKEELNKMPGGAPLDLSLAALPIKGAEASVYAPTDNKLISKTFGTGLFPIFGSQKAPFTLYLTRWGADINDALIGNSVSSNTGIPIAVTFTFQGLTPPAKLHIEADYKKIFNHYSSDKAFAAKASYYGWYGASTEMRWSKIEEKLKVDGALKVTKITSEDISDENMNAVMQGVMKRINDNIIQLMTPPASIPPATAAMPTVSGRFGGAGYNVSYKTFKQDTEYKENFDWTEQKIVERKTLAGGFIGIGQYSPEIRERVVQFVPNFNWDLAHFVLPDVGILPRLTQITINTELMHGQEITSTQSGKWTPTAGWKSIPGNLSITSLDFAIAPLLQNGAKREDLKFRSKTVIVQAGKTTELVEEQKVVQGGIPVTPPTEGLSTIVFDPTDLQFKNLVSGEKLLRVGIAVTIGARSYSDILQPTMESGQFKMPNTLAWIVKTADTEKHPVKVTLKFDYTTGTNPLSRSIVIDDLKSIEPGLNYLIRDPIASL